MPVEEAELEGEAKACCATQRVLMQSRGELESTVRELRVSHDTALRRIDTLTDGLASTAELVRLTDELRDELTARQDGLARVVGQVEKSNDEAHDRLGADLREHNALGAVRIDELDQRIVGLELRS